MYVGIFTSLGASATFWISVETGPTGAYYMYLNSNSSSIGFNDFDKDAGFSIRCLKD
jgi:uncharacterized protein (TIGR02145 family)